MVPIGSRDHHHFPSALVVGSGEAMRTGLVSFSAAVVFAAVSWVVAVAVETLPWGTRRSRETGRRAEREQRYGYSEHERT